MSKTVTCLYQDQQKASEIVSRLEQAGISRGGINVYSDASDNLIDDLENAGVPRSDAHAYAEGMRRGGSVVAVECDDDEVDRLIDILDDDGVLDLDEQRTAWNSEGWQGHDTSTSGGMTSGLGAAAAGLAGGLTGSSGTSRTDVGAGDDVTGSPDITRAKTDTTRTSGGDEVIPIAEEDLHVGKREVGQGRVRIQSRVVETPVSEQVTLREERVDVERRPVSGATQAGTLGGDPFQERTIEVEERHEEAVVSKEARVVEEVVVRKDVEQRTETVSDTVRRTEVDVEDERNVRSTGTTDSTDGTR
ncbi:YsnF/AvaK domain-containing protein [Microvirga aerilata]|uniref:YsnF/AvaK domain-containing protein n=1 Tax=Microvirga aerilata TaxID=670292 RepID=A0A936ZN99_9HYPH|nr:YsnF/AvaK domain-containing protein [Microvirga aerilata]MBL0407708.1 YsnF/AvaK domain-containing protein [Microvirga aerilata]